MKYFFTLYIKSKYNKRNIMVHPESNIVNVDSVFYLLNNKQFNLAQLLIETLNNMTEEPFKLTKDDLTSYYTLSLRNLKELLYYQIADGIEENIEHELLIPELYIDYEQ